jgi:hypothetical protein
MVHRTDEGERGILSDRSGVVAMHTYTSDPHTDDEESYTFIRDLACIYLVYPVSRHLDGSSDVGSDRDLHIT